MPLNFVIVYEETSFFIYYFYLHKKDTSFMKGISVMKNINKKLFLTAVMTITLSACSTQDNTNNSKTADGYELKPVSHAYDGVDEILGKDYGNMIMPESITVSDFDEVYKLSLNYSSNLGADVDYASEAKEILPVFYGDSFDESLCGFDDHNFYYDYSNGNDYASYNRVLSLRRGSFSAYNVTTDNIDKTVRLKNGGNELIQVGSDTVTANELAETTSGYIDAAFSDIFSDFEIVPLDVHQYTHEGMTYAQVICGQKYKGIYIEEYSSPFSQQTETTLTFYPFTQINFRYKGRNELATLNFSANDVILNAEKVEEIIPLTEAVEILKSELSSYSEYVFDDITLKYCSKTQQPIIEIIDGKEPEWVEEYRKEPTVYVPTWHFICDNENSGYSRWGVKVNALTGEITIDALPGTVDVFD